MAGQHTNGPWEMRPAGKEGRDIAIFRVGVPNSGGRIATVPFREGYDIRPDARLIAAAPEMLSALELVAFDWDDSAPSLAIDAVRKAIATARGQ